MVNRTSPFLKMLKDRNYIVDWSIGMTPRDAIFKSWNSILDKHGMNDLFALGNLKFDEHLAAKLHKCVVELKALRKSRTPRA